MKVLLIEDDQDEAQELTNYFSETDYVVEWASSYDSEEFLDFMSSDATSKIVIVDLDLGDGIEEGGKRAIADMWSMDRTTFFIVFSQYIKNHSIFDSEEFAPNHVCLKKQYDKQQKFSKSCLSKLHSLLKDAGQTVITPRFPSPLPTSAWMSVLGNASSSPSMKSVKPRQLDHRGLADLGYTFNRSKLMANVLSQRLMSISYSGKHADNIGAALFGSFGRGESRPLSDIELVVFFKADQHQHDEVKDIAVINWNRTIMKTVALDEVFHFEQPRPAISREITNSDGNNVKVLQRSFSGDSDSIALDFDSEDAARNQFAPIINITSFLSEIRKTHMNGKGSITANYLNRIFQILCEYKPLYNAELLQSIRLELVEIFAKECTLTRDVSEQELFRHMIEGYERDTIRQRVIDNPYACKAFVFRYMNTLAFRAMLCRYLYSPDEEFSDEYKINVLLKEMAEPGIVKVARCVNVAEAEGKADVAATAAQWLVSYWSLLNRMSLVTNTNANPKVVTFRKDIKRAILDAADYFKAVEDLVGDNYPWITNWRGMEKIQETA